jgi:hypothetical protein
MSTYDYDFKQLKQDRIIKSYFKVFNYAWKAGEEATCRMDLVDFTDVMYAAFDECKIVTFPLRLYVWGLNLFNKYSKLT